MTEKLYNRFLHLHICPLCLNELTTNIRENVAFINVKVNKKYRPLAVHSVCLDNKEKIKFFKEDNQSGKY